ncbi:MAG: DUF389 domain-containing protein [Nocardioidaceae bacterium]
MLHLRMRVPARQLDQVVALLDDNPTTVNVLVVSDSYRKPAGDALVSADIARESAQRLLNGLRQLGIPQNGSIAIADNETLLSHAATEAEHRAPGSPIDGVVWDIVENNAREDIRPSFAFVAFLTLAALIAGVGRLQDQPILIVGAMVVGPEFAPMAAICFAIARPRPSLLPRALVTLVGGYLIATAIATAIWTLLYVMGAFSHAAIAHRPLTDFIVQPNWWSFFIAVLAGIAGVLSLTTDKSSILVGVFISVTTIPAIGTLALGISTLDGHVVHESLVQLGVNIAGIIIAGTLTLLILKLTWERVKMPGPAPRVP